MLIPDECGKKLLCSAAKEQWERIGVRPHHGINVPLFSLHSKKSCGIGEFPDLFPLIDWCKEVGMDVIQLLPLNDAGLDSSPYNSLSAFALNPLFLGISQLPGIEEHKKLKEDIEKLKRLNESQRVQYKKLIPIKRRILKKYAQLEYPKHNEGDPSYLRFFIENPWVESYSLFIAIKEQQGWRSWENWPESIRHPNEEALKILLEEHEEEIKIHSFLQYLCFQQMEAVKNYANKHKILIKGDIPILISRDSADVWLHRSFFKTNFSAGAPPDMYSANGQNWGFPIYNWNEIEKDHYSWWRQRLETCARLYHIYRIDHVVGFFRIWAIPKNKSGKEGRFDPESEDTWIDHGKKIMRVMLESCPMLPIGEDLGTVPPEVRCCLESLGICGTKVIRWERAWNEDKRFIPKENYPTISMTTVSTHDSEPLSLWWKNNPQEAKDFAEYKKWDYAPLLSTKRSHEILWDSHHSTSIFHINLLQEYLSLIPSLTWPKIEDERINVPNKISEKNWSYRFRLSLEEMLHNETLKRTIKEIIA